MMRLPCRPSRNYLDESAITDTQCSPPSIPASFLRVFVCLYMNLACLTQIDNFFYVAMSYFKKAKLYFDFIKFFLEL
jgi:hypothetical protein